MLRVVLALLLFALPLHAQQAEAPAAPIDVAEDVASDGAIRDRITDILREIDGYEDVRIDVTAGVVTLSGEVIDSAAAARLEDLTSRVDGVVAIENEVTETTDLSRRLTPAVDRIEDRIAQTVALLPLAGIALIAALLVAGFGWIASRAGLFDRLAPNAFIAEIYRQVFRLAFIVLAVVLALDILGATALLGTILGAAGIVGLAIGFAVRDTVENFIASVMLSVRQPFAPNDLVEIEGDMGKVIRLTSRATILLSLDGNHIRIPNATVFKGRIVNYTRNRERQFRFDIGVETDSDLGAVRKMVTETVAALPFVLETPPVLVWLEALNETGAVLTVTAWIDQHESNFQLARSEALRRVKDAIEASGVAIPDTTYRIRLDGGAGTITEVPADAPPEPRVRGRSLVSDADADADVAETPEMLALEKIVDEERAEDNAGSDLLAENGKLE